jgi:hypothetical protein
VEKEMSIPGESNKRSLHCISGGMSCMPTYLSRTQQFTNVAGIFCGEKFIFNTYAKQVTGERSWKLGHSKSPDFKICNYYYDYLYETMIYSM